MSVSDRDPMPDASAFTTRRLLLTAGLGILLLVVVIGGTFTSRAVMRELAATRLQSDFVSAVSHEFRTPLTSLRQFTDLLNDEVEPPPAKRRAFYQAQTRATARLQRLVESLLDFGRMEAGARPYALETRDASGIVQAVVDDFRREMQLPEQAVCLDCPGPVPVRADREALSLALWNLLDNAVKYSPEPPLVEVTVHAREQEVVIAVRDHGVGIPPHEQSVIFQKFRRGREAHINGARGTGIGLAMVRHIIAAHGGRVTVDSEPSQGSTFTIVLKSAVRSP